MTAKIRTNLYLDENLRDEAKIFFKKYGISLSNGINLLLKQHIQNGKVPLLDELELLNKDDDDYKAIEKTSKDETISLDEFMKI